MGNTYEVSVWENHSDGMYGYRTKYDGESFLKAIYMMIKLKRAGIGCVKFEWR